MADSQVRTPYNFVPFSNRKPLLPYSSFSELPAHDRIDPRLKTGEIHITLRAETPVFVSDGNKDDPHFFRGANGAYMIPGSTVRGMIRENMQILGYGLVKPGEDLEDYQIYYREMSAARGSTGGKLKERYRDTLGIESRRDAKSGKTYSVPTKVRSGYLANEGGKYVIYPTAKPYMKVSRKHADVQQFGRFDARVVPVAYLAENDRVTKITAADQAGPGMKRGFLLYTGRPVGRDPNHLYLFPGEYLTEEAIPIPEADILSYRIDYESRENSLRGALTTAGKQSGDQRDVKEWLGFWRLPENGDRKPVFFTRIDGHHYFGMALFLRIGYSHSISEGLPDAFKAAFQDDDCPLDYPHAILGFASDQKGIPSYRSRVSVGDCTICGPAKDAPEAKVILGGPKPSYYPGYLESGKNYEEDGFRLRGYKQYWLKEVQTTSVPDDKQAVGTTLRPLSAGTEFRGVIRFNNLSDPELGLLLWSLRLEDNCYQTIGMGKPYGYGRVKLTITDLKELDVGRLYGEDAAASPWQNTTGRVADYINSYENAAAKQLHLKKATDIRSGTEIQDFFFMKSAIRNAGEVSYMELEEYRNIRQPLPRASDVRESEEKRLEAEKEKNRVASMSQEDQMKELLEKYRNKYKKL